MEESRRTNNWNLGAKGWVIILLSFVTVYINSAMTSDSLNVVIPVFSATKGLDATFLYSLSTVATVCGVIGSILFGKLMKMRTLRLTWALTMFLTAAFSLIWGQAGSNATYALGYLLAYTTSTVASMLLSYQVIGNWFPRKRGIAMGFITAGYPLSAATTSTVCSAFAANISNFYNLMAVLAIIIGLIVAVFVRDFPEEKGAYPDNDKNFDFELAKKEHEQNLQYLKTSKWTIKKVLTCRWMWLLWFSIGIQGFLSMGIMSNFMNKFLEYGYETTEILVMLMIAGLLAIPGSIFIGWLDTKLGTKTAAIVTYILGIAAIAFNLTYIRPLHYCSLPILALMLGGSANFLVSCTSAIWGRYDFQNAFRVIQPLNAIICGLGITTVGVIGTNVSYTASYITMLILAIIGCVAFVFLKVEPIDKEVR